MEIIQSNFRVYDSLKWFEDHNLETPMEKVLLHIFYKQKKFLMMMLKVIKLFKF